ncbi:FGGY-family carbohydrate kinase [Leifsonia sp. A12D58]|uniref:FGGY-family carbohydrate kinase n=1 Tax=Leifsonia sp. A12D58 TaxID=3397674 RepID=UPI0039E0CD59
MNGISGRAVVLGIDLATANARVIAVDAETGVTIAERTALLPAPQGCNGVREQAPAYAEVAQRLIAMLTADLGQSARGISALSITGTSGTIVPTDDRGRPAGPALLYNDARGAAELAELARAGQAGRPSTALARTAWLDRNRPAARYLFTPDCVAAALAGEIVSSDTSHALKSGINPVTRAWNDKALATLGLDVKRMPDIVSPGRAIGTVTDSIARSLGLPKDVVIVSGMTDGCTSQLATGAVSASDTVGVLGTTLVLKAVCETEITEPSFGVYSHVAPDGSFWVGGASNSGAGVLGRGAAARLDVRESDRRAAALGGASVVMYPLSGVGERFPVADRMLQGFSIDHSGASLTTTDPIERHRAVLEGVGFVERLGLTRLHGLGVSLGRHHLSGGGSSSSVWNVIRASILGREVVVPLNRSSAFGAAILAVNGLVTEGLPAVASRMAGSSSVVEPDPAQVAGLSDRYDLFLAELRREGHLAS